MVSTDKDTEKVPYHMLIDQSLRIVYSRFTSDGYPTEKAERIKRLHPGWFSIPEVSILVSIPQVLVSVLVSANSIDTLTDTMHNTPHHHTFSFFSFLLLF